MARFAERPKPIKSSFPIEGCGLALIGESGGDEEHMKGRPFVGPSGRKLNEHLDAADIARDSCFVSNVFNHHPPGNKFNYYFEKKPTPLNNGSTPLYMKGFGYVKPEWMGEISRLQEELEQANVKVIVALGAKPMQFFTGQTKISKCRGTVMGIKFGGRQYKLVPTYHPSYVLRTGGWSEEVVKDLELAKSLADNTFAPPPDKVVWVDVTMEDLYRFERLYMNNPSNLLLGIDIETDHKKTRQIDCIGFAPSNEVSIVVPFLDRRKKNWHYWATPEEEVEAWLWCAKWLQHPEIVKVGQNFMYDIQYLWSYGLPVRGRWEDTLVMAHVVEPQKEKDLASLSSRYTNQVVPWKTMVSFSSEKGDE